MCNDTVKFSFSYVYRSLASAFVIMDNARERRVRSFVFDSIRDLRRLTRASTTSLHIVKQEVAPEALSRGGLGCSERYVKSYRRKQIICR